MLNAIWTAMILGAVLMGAVTGRLDRVAESLIGSAQAAVTLAIGLVGMMIFWLGLMRVLARAGVVTLLARLLRPATLRLFPEVPPNHPAIGAIILNMVCNILGLGNAATPFGLKAMVELERLNPRPGTATNAMVTFLAINTSGLAVIPTGMMALRASLGSQVPGSIVAPTLLATTAATGTGIVVARLLAHWRRDEAPPPRAAEASVDVQWERDIEAATALEGEAPLPPPSRPRQAAAWGLAAALAGAVGWAFWQQLAATEAAWPLVLRQDVERWALLLLLSAMLTAGLGRGVPLYQTVVDGGREGLRVAERTLPFLVAILVATGMLRASGGIDLIGRLLGPAARLLGMPAEALPMALIRPLSGQGAYGIAAEIMRAHGPDSRVGTIVSTMMGSTETTFYVLALYLGAVKVTRPRHTVVACLAADVAGLGTAVWACRLLLG